MNDHAASANSVSRPEEDRYKKSVCLCGSFRFYDEIVDLRNALQARGVLCEWPLLGLRRAPQAMTVAEAKVAILQHPAGIDRTDLMSVFNKGGYGGNSVVMEIG